MIPTPDHTTLSRRSALVEIPRFARRHDEPVHLAVDSTGLKIVGDGEWHAHRQARAENGMFRFKRIIGGEVRAKRFEAQQREATIGVLVLNRMTQLGMPQSVAVTS